MIPIIHQVSSFTLVQNDNRNNRLVVIKHSEHIRYNNLECEKFVQVYLVKYERKKYHIYPNPVFPELIN